MMAFDFPSSPTAGQTYSVTGGPTYVYNGTAWQVLTPGNQFNRTVFTATAGQTTFTMNYVVGAIDVYRNGVKLAPADFTATSGTSIVLANGCTVGDTVEVISYPMITYTDAVKRTGDTMTGALTVSTALTTGTTLNLQNTSTGGDVWALYSNGSGNSEGAGKFMLVKAGTGANLIVDTAGRMTKPYQPFFYAYATNNINYNTSSTKITVHDVALHNVGNCYSTSTFRFTAPIAGLYQFTARAWALGGNTTDSGITFVVNGITSNNIGVHRLGPTSYFSSLLPTTYIKLNAGDYVELYTETASPTGVVHTSSGQYSMFSGYLLG
jgi:lipid-A-disaccharide synthase-like uncharacterized protein